MRTTATIAFLAVANAIKTHQGIDESLIHIPAGPEEVRPAVQNADDISEGCAWLKDNVDWEAVEAAGEARPEEGEAVVWDAIWSQVEGQPEFQETGMSEEQAKHIAIECRERHQFHQEMRRREADD